MRRKPQVAWDVNANGLFKVLEITRERKVSRVFCPSSIVVFGPETPKDDTPRQMILIPGRGPSTTAPHGRSGVEAGVRPVGDGGRYGGEAGIQARAGTAVIRGSAVKRISLRLDFGSPRGALASGASGFEVALAFKTLGWRLLTSSVEHIWKKSDNNHLSPIVYFSHPR
jgi:hypothetical protein